jgi:hypothetical protein
MEEDEFLVITLLIDSLTMIKFKINWKKEELLDGI